MGFAKAAIKAPPKKLERRRCKYRSGNRSLKGTKKAGEYKHVEVRRRRRGASRGRRGGRPGRRGGRPGRRGGGETREEGGGEGEEGEEG